jgi:4'-phosphopantetheinyl transferase
MISRSRQTVLAFPPVDPPTPATQVATVVPDDQTVHVWSFALGHKTSVLQRCQAWLSEQERARAQRFIHAAQGNDFILAHGALRGVLARYLALAPEAIEFHIGSTGKPILLNASGSSHALRFNLSHSHGRMLVAVAKGREVGIDLEQVRETLDALKLGERFFAAAEYEDLKNRTEQDRTWQFYRYWVAKEAVLKGQGIGIESLQQCEILPDGCGPRPSATVRCLDSSARQGGWTIQWLNCGAGWQGAVSADGSDWTVRIMDGETP